jgi:hypothetical protein
MIKKVLASVVAAAALSVPLAAVAGADPTLDNRGVPDTIGRTPGSVVSSLTPAQGGAPLGTNGLGESRGWSSAGRPPGK